MKQVNLEQLPDGTFIDWGRHWRVFGKEGEGPARYYGGESAEVIALVLKHQVPK